MAYTYLDFAGARQQLASKLNDQNDIFWSQVEKNLYIQEALRTWNSLTSFWRAEFTFNTTPNQIWYDITSVANSLRTYNQTDSNILQMIQLHFLEPSPVFYPLVWRGSNQFDYNDLLNAIQRRRDEMISDSGCTVTQSLVAANPGRTFLPDNVIDIRRIAWLPTTDPSGQFVAGPVMPGDQFGLGAYDNGFTSRGTGTPFIYMQSAEPPLSFDVDTDPAINGQYEFLTINAGAPLSFNNGSLLDIPDDFSWVVKFGAMADLLGKDSNARDSLRQQYCEQRYRQGIAALFTSPAIVYARVNNIPIDVDSIHETDNFRSGWQAEDPSSPDLLATAGLNLIGVIPTPDDGQGVNYSITLGVVQNAPITDSNDNIQVSRDNLEVILDYAQHLASFKMGGIEFMSTMPLLERFHTHAATYNSRLNELSEFTKPMYELSQQQSETDPVFETDPTADKV